MKILVILPNLGGGGAEKVHISLANNWVKNGHEVTICSGLITPDSPFEIDKRINVIHLNCRKIRDLIFPLKKVIDEEKADRIYTAMWPLTIISIISWIFSGRLGKLFLVEHTSFNERNAKNIMKTNLGKISLSMKIFYGFADGVVCVSKGVANSINKISYVNKRKIHTIYNGLQAFPTIPKPSKVQPGNIEIISIGRLSDDKDYQTTFKALALLKEDGIKIKLKIIGDGPNLELLRNEAKTLKLLDNISFLGFKKNIFKHLVDADLLVHSSNFEGFSMAILEAISCGKNVVSTDTPHGPSEILDNGKFGSLVEVGNYEAMAKAIKFRIKNPISSKVLIERSKKFSIDEASKQYLELTS